MTVITTEDRILARLERQRATGKDFSPADIANELGTTTKNITQSIRDIPGVVRKKKCAATRYGYTSSVWGFEPVQA